MKSTHLCLQCGVHFSQTCFDLRNCIAAFKELCRYLLALKDINSRHYREVLTVKVYILSSWVMETASPGSKYSRGQSLMCVLPKTGLWVYVVFGVVWFLRNLRIINWRPTFTGWWAANTELICSVESCKLGTERRCKHSADLVWV